MIDIGTGLAILGIGGTITAAIIKFVPPIFGSNGNGCYVKKDLCDERSGHIQSDIKEIKETVNKIFDKMEAK